MKRLPVFLLVAMLLSGSLGLGSLRAGDENEGRPSLPAIFQEQIRAAGRDFVYLIGSPLRFRPLTFLQLSGLVFLEAGMVYHVDGKADEEFALEGSHTLLYPAEQLADIGGLYDRLRPEKVTIGVIALTGTAGLMLNDARLIETARLAFESSLATGLITIGLKGLFGRSRPYVANDPLDFHFFKFSKKGAFRSFPSGHTSGAFALATVFSLQYPRWWVRTAAYGIATGVALQRMEDRMHWASDVVFGAVVGSWVAHQLVEASHPRPSGKRVRAYLQPGLVSVAIHF
ncbi:MAG: phosphatase PAP2 family protein [Calditrichaeota bacterium]|nr:MAG: phosphatase PAP2 family protein [Calditrichota bacterium]